MDTEFRLVSRFLPLPHGRLGSHYHIVPHSPDRLFSFYSAFQAEGKDSLYTALFPLVAHRRLAKLLHLAKELIPLIAALCDIPKSLIGWTHLAIPYSALASTLVVIEYGTGFIARYSYLQPYGDRGVKPLLQPATNRDFIDRVLRPTSTQSLDSHPASPLGGTCWRSMSDDQKIFVLSTSRFARQGAPVFARWGTKIRRANTRYTRCN